MAEAKRAGREAVLAGMPYLGVCFGAQILADVFGARGFRGPERRAGERFFAPTRRRSDSP
jgi:GMP synthase-like glutamine amidotransferase